MTREPLPCNFLPFRTRLAIIAIGVNRDTAARSELPPNLYVLWIHQGNKILHDDVHAVLMKVTMITEAKQVELQALAFHHALARNIRDINGSEVGLSRDRTKTCKFRAVELNKIVVFGVLIEKRL